MGVNTQQNDYYEGLFRRTTASYTAKLDKENVEKIQAKSKIYDLQKPATSKQTNNESRRILYERYNYETSSSSFENVDNKNKTKIQQHHRNCKPKTNKADINISVIKALIEEKLNQVLRENISPQIAENNEASKDKMTIKAIVEDVLKEKLIDLRQPEREKINTHEPGSLRAMIEDIVGEILKTKLSNLPKINYNEHIVNLEKDLHQKLNVSNEKTQGQQPGSLVQGNSNRSLDSQALVDELLDYDEGKKQALKTKTKPNKESSTQTSSGGIKRLQRSPRKKPEWQDPSQDVNLLDKPLRPLRGRSPTQLSSVRSGRSSSVMIPRSAYQHCHKKPKSDPVALYQYYKNEWEHFRMQIPGETPHNRLRWHVRQGLLDPK